MSTFDNNFPQNCSNNGAERGCDNPTKGLLWWAGRDQDSGAFMVCVCERERARETACGVEGGGAKRQRGEREKDTRLHSPFDRHWAKLGHWAILGSSRRYKPGTYKPGTGMCVGLGAMKMAAHESRTLHPKTMSSCRFNSEIKTIIVGHVVFRWTICF